MTKSIGWTIFGTLVFYLLSVPIPFFLTIATFLAWLIPILSRQNLSINARRQALLLSFLGGGALLFSAYQGVFIGWKNIFALNVPVLAMFVAVSFLSLTNPTNENASLPQGISAAVTTGFGIHLLAAVINLSALFLVGERLQKKGLLSREQLILISRSFTAAAWWSPFFIATGVALTYAPEMHWQNTLIPGAIMSVIGICYSITEVCFFGKKEFSGYPFKRDSLAVPLFLAAVVIFVHFQWNQMSVLLIICLIAPVGAILFMKERPRIQTIQNYIEKKISSVSSPFALFLAAGVFSSGLKSVILVYPDVVNINNLTLSPLLFASLLGGMIIVGMIGVHPVVSISIVSPLLLPLNPDHSQLGFLFVTGWAISTCSSPLSGVGLVLVSHFHIPPKVILKNNLLYAFMMWAIASLLNIVFYAV